MAASLFDKIWSQHLVREETRQAPAVLYVDSHLLHEVTSPQAFGELAARGVKVRRPDRCLATMDHAVPTLPADEHNHYPFVSDEAARQVDQLRSNCALHGITLFDWHSADRGIVHVIGPELGVTQPGMTIVCGDSHTSTHGAFGALAFGIGTTEVGHVLATQCLLQRKPKSMKVQINGELGRGVSAKDLTLHVVGMIGVNGGAGHVIEYCGSTVEGMSMEERMTLCNMSIECGAKAGMVAPDEVTFAYLKGRKHAPAGRAWRRHLELWRALPSDPNAKFDHSIDIQAEDVPVTITYGTNPAMVIPVDASIPEDGGDSRLRESLAYMGFDAGNTLLGTPVDIVFIGSCTNGRISDLRIVAEELSGQQVAAHTRTIVVPGSEAVKRQAEGEGLDRVFLDAGAEWRNPGCSMCIAMNGDFAQPGELVVSTSNRNFTGRQGAGARTLLASPRTAAASAIAGVVASPVKQSVDQG